MKSTAIALTAVLATAASAYAMEPAKLMDSSAGKIWTDEKGMTLYTFDKDEKDKSNCYDKCAAAWPPLKAAADAMAEGEWKVVDRTDGSKMWAYDGHPLYTFVDDKKPGDVTGDGKGGVWHVAKGD
jgi:predicted lipoprotein with Yx(FWY)xxD motif